MSCLNILNKEKKEIGGNNVRIRPRKGVLKAS
jgi:hypothetical protein